MLLLFVWGGVFFGGGGVFTNMPTIFFGLATTSDCFQKKLHTKRTTCIQLYNNSGQSPDFKIFSVYVQSTEHKWNSLFVFGCIQNHQEQNLSERGDQRGGRSGGDGQVHIFLFGRGRRYGNVIILFLRASGG